MGGGDRCVVCGGAIEAPRFANAWERSRGTFPCCGDACATAFDSDVHWLPARAPAPPDAIETRRLLALAVNRLAKGDLPRAIAREMLQAGVPIAPVRDALTHARDAAAAAQRSATRRSILGVIGLAVKGRGTLAEARNQREPAAYAEALADLDRWQARFAPLDPR